MPVVSATLVRTPNTIFNVAAGFLPSDTIPTSDGRGMKKGLARASQSG